MFVVFDVTKEEGAWNWIVELNRPIGVPIHIGPGEMNISDIQVTPATADTLGIVFVDCYLQHLGGEPVRQTGGLAMTIHLPDPTSGTDEDETSRKVFALLQNRPNPLTGSSSIRYSIPHDGEVSLRIYDITGRSVRSLVSGTEQAGWHTAIWDGSTQRGKPTTGGVYFYKLEFDGKRTLTRKLMRVR